MESLLGVDVSAVDQLQTAYWGRQRSRLLLTQQDFLGWTRSLVRSPRLFPLHRLCTKTSPLFRSSIRHHAEIALRPRYFRQVLHTYGLVQGFTWNSS